MSITVGTDKKIILLSFAAAATTVIAGILHLMMAPRSLSQEMGEGILFLVGGVLQIFWAIPVIKRWGRIWQVIGIVGTAVFVILWFVTHTHSLLGGAPQGPPPDAPNSMPQGNMTGEHFPRGHPPRGIASIPQIEYFQFAFIGLYAVLSKMMSKQKIKDNKPSDEGLKQ